MPVAMEVPWDTAKDPAENAVLEIESFPSSLLVRPLGEQEL